MVKHHGILRRLVEATSARRLVEATHPLSTKRLCSFLAKEFCMAILTKAMKDILVFFAPSFTHCAYVTIYVSHWVCVICSMLVAFSLASALFVLQAAALHVIVMFFLYCVPWDISGKVVSDVIAHGTLLADYSAMLDLRPLIQSLVDTNFEETPFKAYLPNDWFVGEDIKIESIVPTAETILKEEEEVQVQVLYFLFFNLCVTAWVISKAFGL